MENDSNFTLTGQIVDGQVVLDPFQDQTTTSTSTSFGTVDPDPTGSFVAVNAPFDPESCEEMVAAEA